MPDLSESQIEIIKNTWYIYSPDIKGNGCQLFAKWFADNPSHLPFYKKITGEIMGNPEVIKQATVDFQFITNLIENIDNNYYFEDTLSKLSARHKQRKITIEMFERLGLVIMGELIDKLGPDLMNAVENK
ncbi:unnamed protein product [Oppiella nova]|uniref:Globin domain-containing protein n=1 Tax=Oppiella nova TaxID=334625 RepID=A0A7R9QR53_9ACAR|nr:unnamed protein product [Oppiella nova]CAG2170809.1 unnamed protein product [Oppiella nova]